MFLPAKKPVINFAQRKISIPKWKWPSSSLQVFVQENGWTSFVLKAEQYMSDVVT